jgi:hypothetical protein
MPPIITGVDVRRRRFAHPGTAYAMLLTELGWHATITHSGPDWLLGEARPMLRALPRTVHRWPSLRS